jgi:CRISPR type III-A-associated protein Csm2
MARYLARDARPALTTGQVRRFFNHCRVIERRLAVDGEPWTRVAANFEMLGCHAQNAQAAGKIPREFQRFIDDNVARVTSSADPRTSFLKGFLPHFEALVGFGAAYLKARA